MVRICVAYNGFRFRAGPLLIFLKIAFFANEIDHNMLLTHIVQTQCQEFFNVTTKISLVGSYSYWLM